MGEIILQGNYPNHDRNLPVDVIVERVNIYSQYAFVSYLAKTFLNKQYSTKYYFRSAAMTSLSNYFRHKQASHGHCWQYQHLRLTSDCYLVTYQPVGLSQRLV